MALPVELWPHIGGGGGNRTRVRRIITYRIYRLSFHVHLGSVAQEAQLHYHSTIIFVPKQLVLPFKNYCILLRSCKPMQLQLTERLLSSNSQLWFGRYCCTTMLWCGSHSSLQLKALTRRRDLFAPK